MHSGADVSQAQRVMSRKGKKAKHVGVAQIPTPIGPTRVEAAPLSEPPRNRLGVIAVLIFLSVAAGFWYWDKTAPTPSADQGLVANRARNNCKGTPAFVGRANFSMAPALSTSERDQLGMALVAHDPATGQRSQVWQHPSWRSAGNLSAFVVDKRGDVYVLPSPRVNLSDNPPELQNRLYRIDHSSAEMRLALEFPVAAPVDQRNPYAGLGLSYDCGTDSLYLSSVAGSTYTEERGRIFRISGLPSPKISSRIEGIDALSLLSVDSNLGIALLFGSARNGEIRALQLDAQGNFLPDLRTHVLADLRGLGPEGNDRARRIEVASDATLSVRGMRFAYNLAQPSAQASPNNYRFAFDLKAQRYLPQADSR